MTTELRPQIADYSHLEPLPDPPPREPDMQQERRIFAFYGILDLHFAHRDDVLIAGGGYLRNLPYDSTEIFAPDCVIAFGVNPDGIVARNGYVISEVGKPPDFVLEVASRSTGRRDYTVKRDGYAAYGVQEYWRFDPSGGRFHDASLAGDLLVGEQYQPFPINQDPDGLLWGYSPMLDLELCWEQGRLRFRDPYTREFLPAPAEERLIRESAEARADQAEARADQAEAQRDAAEERIRQLEAQIQQQQDT